MLTQIRWNDPYIIKYVRSNMWNKCLETAPQVRRFGRLTTVGPTRGYRNAMSKVTDRRFIVSSMEMINEPWPTRRLENIWNYRVDKLCYVCVIIRRWMQSMYKKLWIMYFFIRYKNAEYNIYYLFIFKHRFLFFLSINNNPMIHSNNTVPWYPKMYLLHTISRTNHCSFLKYVVNYYKHIQWNNYCIFVHQLYTPGYC